MTLVFLIGKNRFKMQFEGKGQGQVILPKIRAKNHSLNITFSITKNGYDLDCKNV